MEKVAILNGNSRKEENLLDRLAGPALFLSPVLFCANMLTAKATAELVPPVALAFWRWTITFAILLFFAGRPVWRHRRTILSEWKDLLILGGLGMGVCGAFVYVGAHTTTATNIGLIYAASPVLIIVMAALFYKEPTNLRQLFGITLSLAGVVLVVAKGRLDALLSLNFTPGDLWIVASSTGWALYSVLLRHRPTTLPPMTRFAAITLAGMIVLLPFYIGETLPGAPMTVNTRSVAAVLFLAVVASFGAYQVYAWLQRTLGAGRAGLVLYLAPVYNGFLAYALLGETLKPYHFIGAALVLPGIALATRKR